MWGKRDQRGGGEGSDPEREVADLLDPVFLHRLERLELNARKILSGERRGETPTRRRGPGTLFREHRDYVPGDDTRFIDWNAFLRLGDLLVKEFEAEQMPRLLLFVDRSGSMGLAEGRKLASARRLAAALGYIALCRHAAVLRVTIPLGGEPRLYQGRAAISRFFDGLVRAESEGETQFMSAVRVACPPGRPTGIAVVISDFLESSEYAQALRYLRHRGCVVHALHVVDPAELETRPGGMVELVDVETGRRRRERIDSAMAAAYQRTLHHHFRTLEEVCRGLHVSYQRVMIDDPVEKSVLALLQRGALLQ
jgi:uncharacterized protein (DUF58 family)